MKACTIVCARIKIALGRKLCQEMAETNHRANCIELWSALLSCSQQQHRRFRFVEYGMDFGMKTRRLVIGLGICVALVACFGVRAWADQNYSQQVFFDNSLSPGSYFYSSGRASFPSTLNLLDDKLPIETASFISAPNALVLDWTSRQNGGWAAEIHLYEWRNRAIEFPGAYL